MRKWGIGVVAILMALTLCACLRKDADNAADVKGTEIAMQGTDLAKTKEEIKQAVATQEVLKKEVTTEAIMQEATKEMIKEESKETNNKQTAKEKTEITETIKSVFAKYNMKAGTCLSEQMINDERCAKIITDNFNSITLENQMKPEAILDQSASKEAGDLVVKFDETTQALLKWCSDNDMAVRGHTMIWYSQTPDWIFYENFDNSATLVSREVMLARMESYIRQIFEQLEELGYLELFYAYDVVNEALNDNGTKRDNLWLQTIGDDYIWYAFYYADMYAPDYIDLYYNDYNEQYKKNPLCNLVETLVDENGNYLIDGIGLQAHLYTGDSLISYLTVVEKLAAEGLKINLTELDVSLGTWTNIKDPTEENLKVQGKYYYNLINGLLQMVEEDKIRMDALTFWGFADELSWRAERSPLLFDTAFEPKYAYYGAVQLKNNAGFEE